MGAEDCERQALNVYRMKLLGAKVHPVTTGTSTLKDAVSEALREWTNRMSDTHYVLGSVMGAHPFPMIVRDFQSIISREAREQILEVEGKLPTAVMACVGGGSNAMGMFYHFIPDESVRLIGCEAAGRGIDTEEHAATIAKGSVGIFHGMNRTSAKTKMDKSLQYTLSLQASITLVSALNMRTCTIAVVLNTCLLQMTKQSMPLNIYLVWKVLFQPLKVLMRWHMHVKLLLL